jgi:hypothetical protein
MQVVAVAVLLLLVLLLVLAVAVLLLLSKWLVCSLPPSFTISQLNAQQWEICTTHLPQQKV